MCECVSGSVRECEEECVGERKGVGGEKVGQG